MRNTHISLIVASAISLAASVVHAQAQPKTANTPDVANTGATQPELTDGEIKKIDLEAKKITLKHGEIKNLEMPPMTMVFQVADVKLIEKLKAGDKVKFVAEQSKGKLLITNISITE